MGASVSEICEYLESFAPQSLAEDWDNVGLLVGHRNAEVQRLMTCLTLTPLSCQEAMHQKADIVVTHHPMPFMSLKQITDDSTVGKILLSLIENGVAIYSPHTAFDSTRGGINQQLADGLGLLRIAPLIESDEEAGLGTGRFGNVDGVCTLADIIERVKSLLNISGVHSVGDLKQNVSSVAVACGAAGQFLQQAADLGCQAFVTGETNFHTCLEAEARGVGLILPGHFASERFAVETLADQISEQFPELSVWPAKSERDPLVWT